MGLFFKKFLISFRHSGADLFSHFLVKSAAMRSTQQVRNEPNLIGARQLHELAGQGAQLPPPAVKFTDENGGGPGVRLRKRQRAKQSEQTKN